jgi:3-oxoacyl-[acyl-carrier protein] reductase
LPAECSLSLAKPVPIIGAIDTKENVMSKLAGKVAVVTGASKGIGAGIAKALAAEGASVVVNYASSKAGADAVVSAITAAGGKAVAVGGDVSKAADAQGIIDTAIETYGRLDILVNNSGIYEFSPIEAITEEHYRKQFDTNVFGLLLTTQAAVKHLKEGASIINVSSVVTTITPPETAVYSGTKGAVDAITGVLARELGPRKIRVNAINPGMIVTEGSQSAGVIGSDFETQVVGQTPLGRVGQPDDIAKAVVFLASDDAGWLTGERIVASGGLR